MRRKQTSKSKHAAPTSDLRETQARVQMDGILQRINRPTKVFLVSLGLVLLIGLALWGFIHAKYLAPVNASDKTVIEVEIPRGSGINTIGRILEENGIIRNKTIFKLYVDLYDRGSKLRSGTYELSPSMELMEIINTLCSGESTDNVAKLLIKEGYTVDDIANLLVQKGVIDKPEEFTNALKDLSPYTQAYPFLEEPVKEKDKRKNPAEGYLFPDTYEVYSDAKPEEVANKLWYRFTQIYSDTYQQRAEELDMTTDEVITLASLIQKEAKSADFKKVSAVFHNRLKAGMPLQSCASVQYIIGVKRLNLTSEDLAIDSPYNTYKNKGLPEGPICNPGKEAIEAALYPDETYLDENYLYFCLGDPETGETVFSKTLQEHNANVEKYRPLWIEADEKNNTTGQ